MSGSCGMAPTERLFHRGSYREAPTERLLQKGGCRELPPESLQRSSYREVAAERTCLNPYSKPKIKIIITTSVSIQTNERDAILESLVKLENNNHHHHQRIDFEEPTRGHSWILSQTRKLQSSSPQACRFWRFVTRTFSTPESNRKTTSIIIVTIYL